MYSPTTCLAFLRKSRKKKHPKPCSGLSTLSLVQLRHSPEARDFAGPEVDVTCSFLQRRSAFGYICRSCVCVCPIFDSFRMAEQQTSTARHWALTSVAGTEEGIDLLAACTPIARGTFPRHSVLSGGRAFSSAFFLPYD